MGIFHKGPIGVGAGAAVWTEAVAPFVHPADILRGALIGGVAAASSDIILNIDGSAVFNEQGFDVGFRIEANLTPDMFRVFGFDRVGINSTSANATLDIRGFRTTDDVLRVHGTAGQTTPTFVVANSATLNQIVFFDTGAAVFNEQGNSVNFRIEANTDVNQFFVEAAVNRIGIGTNTPKAKLDVSATSTTDGTFHVRGASGQITRVFAIRTFDQADNITMTDVGGAVFNEQGNAVDFRIEGDTNPNLFLVDGSADNVDIDSLSINSAYSFPTADGSANQVLTTDGLGVVTFADVAGVANNFVFSHDSKTQTIAVVNTFQDLTYDTNGQLDGWTHAGGSADFTCNQTGKYLVSYDMQTNKTGGGAGNFVARARFNSVEVAGSHVGIDYTTNNVHIITGRTFMIDGVSGQILNIQIAADQTAFEVSIDTQNPGTATTRISTAITITRIT